MFTRAGFIRLAVRLAAISCCRFILSVKRPRDAFARFAIEGVATRYTVAGGKWSDVAEIVVTGPAREQPVMPRDLLSVLAPPFCSSRPQKRDQPMIEKWPLAQTARDVP